MSTPSVESATEQAVKRHRDKVGRIPRRAGLAPHRRTKATLYTVGRLLETWEDPRAILLSVASMAIDDLVKLAQCTPLEALQEKRLCAQAVLPYCAQKLPISVDMRQSKAISLNIVTEAEFKDLETLAAQADEGSLEMQLIAGPIVDAASTPETTHSPRGTDLNDTSSDSRIARQGDETGVLPSVSAPPPRSERPAPEPVLTPPHLWWSSLDRKPLK